MQVDLTRLLKTREIVHPSLIAAVVLREETALFRLRGYQWWRADPISEEADYEFLFSEISDGHVHASMATPYTEIPNRALDDFSIVELENCDWAAPENCQIFCNAPIKNPVAIYSALEEHLRQIDSFWPATRFLNQGFSLSDFLGLTKERSFLLARCPETICDQLVEELERQGAPHNVVRHSREETKEDRLRVRLSGSDFLCRSAIAILPD